MNDPLRKVAKNATAIHIYSCLRWVMFCLRQLDWADLEQSWCQVCLQTHWRTCRGKRRRPQVCSSLRGSSPSNCKFLMELMISACISLMTPNTNSQCGEEKRGGVGAGEGKKNKTQKEEGKEKKCKVVHDRRHCYRHLIRKHNTMVIWHKNTLQDG